MDFDTWSRLYSRLCAAKEHARNAEQSAVYFDVLKDFPQLCVEQAVMRAVREIAGWPKSDMLVALAREERAKMTAPAHSCTICHGAAWVDGPPRVEPWGTFPTAMPCPVCWPKRTKGAAA